MKAEKCKKMIRKIEWFLFAVLTVVLVCFWYINDGAYLIKKATYSDMEIIEEYTSIDFPEDTIIKEMIIESDPAEDKFLGHTEYLEAILDVPSEKINELFPPEIRLSKDRSVMDMSRGKGNMEFSVFSPQLVQKWFYRARCSKHFSVMESEDEYTTIYLGVDYLGWSR